MQYKSLLVVLITLFSVNYQVVTAQTAKEVVTKMFAAIEGVKTMEYKMKMTERMKDGKWNNAKIYARMNVKPFKLYTKTIEPTPDYELLYVTGKYKGKALVKPNGFPWINVKLKPTSSHIMSTQHHPLFDSGMRKVYTVLKAAVKKADNDFEKHFKLYGSTTYDSKECYILKAVDPSFNFTTYTVKKGENLYDLAKKYNIAEYMILENNEGIDDYFDVKAGQKLKIPTAYAKNTTLYIDKKTNLPIFQEMEDNKGLFEKYEFTNLKVNPNFPDSEFTEDGPGYGF